ncbi:concanavalin A-like lectin/glucanase domain-containing protein [Mycena sp. CBHHK59/15]|nr:concanavalin A-like lectin/glucanase domain-containing protein [Mycena sp. CBHHK59/15]
MLYSVTLLALSARVVAYESYSIADTFIGSNFFDSWNWETFHDPTHGRVNYTDKATAQATNLSVASETTFVMRADSWSHVPPASTGRNSVRITSNSKYSEAVMVLDLMHMPTGCATWPAWWTVSKTGPWPHGGEIDIIEGVNLNPSNLASLHTTPNCNMAQTRTQSGEPVSTICDASVNYNQGCGVTFTKPNSYGQAFNSNGGGWYAMQRSASCGINVWFWPRSDPTLVPIEVTQGLGTMNPSQWGEPDASFLTDECDYASHFDAHQIVFDLTFCGDWAGSPSAKSACQWDTCQNFVDNEPAQFIEAYWEISALRVYTLNPVSNTTA